MKRRKKRFGETLPVRLGLTSEERVHKLAISTGSSASSIVRLALEIQLPILERAVKKNPKIGKSEIDELFRELLKEKQTTNA